MYYRFPSFQPNPPSKAKTAQACLEEILSKCDQNRSLSLSHEDSISSSKDKAMDPELREAVKEEAKKESKGGGPSPRSASKTSERVRRYEARGRDYEDADENKNKAQKGPLEKKSTGSKK